MPLRIKTPITPASAPFVGKPPAMALARVLAGTAAGAVYMGESVGKSVTGFFKDISTGYKYYRGVQHTKAPSIDNALEPIIEPVMDVILKPVQTKKLKAN